MICYTSIKLKLSWLQVFRYPSKTYIPCDTDIEDGIREIISKLLVLNFQCMSIVDLSSIDLVFLDPIYQESKEDLKAHYVNLTGFKIIEFIKNSDAVVTDEVANKVDKVESVVHSKNPDDDEDVETRSYIISIIPEESKVSAALESKERKGSSAILLEAARKLDGNSSTLPDSDNSQVSTQEGSCDATATEDDVYDGEFGVNAVIGISMMYTKKEKILMGAITTIKYLGSGPKMICFHLKLLPACKPIARTHWEPAKRKTYAFSFKLSHKKVKPPPNAKSSLSIRLYGKRKKTGVSWRKCYAECIIPWRTITEAGGPLKLEQRMHAKGTTESTLSE